MKINPYHIRMSDPVDGVVTLSYLGLSVPVPAELVALNTDPMMSDNRAEVHDYTIAVLAAAMAEESGFGTSVTHSCVQWSGALEAFVEKEEVPLAQRLARMGFSAHEALPLLAESRRQMGEDEA